ncbi:DEAD/DEAH box helicase, partial [Streptomyces hyaluromycini]
APAFTGTDGGHSAAAGDPFGPSAPVDPLGPFDAAEFPDLDGDFTWPPEPPTAPGDYVSPKDLAPADPFAAPGYGGPRGGSPANRYGPNPYTYGNHHIRTPAVPDPRAVVLAAADPANAYGAALTWPEPPTGAGHKPGRKAGSLVVLVDGELTLYMERGGKTLLAWPSAPDIAATDDTRLRTAAEALAAAARAGTLGTVTVERVNGASALTSPLGTVLEGAGFIATPRGLRLRA